MARRQAQNHRNINVKAELEIELLHRLIDVVKDRELSKRLVPSLQMCS
jgi:uncharacterized membrane protein